MPNWQFFSIKFIAIVSANDYKRYQYYVLFIWVTIA